MATNESSSLQGRNVYITECGFRHDEYALQGSISVAINEAFHTPNGDGTMVLAALVPADGAELVAASFTPLSLGTGTHDQEWSISDGTNVLCQVGPTGVALSITVGTAFAYTMGTTTNGKSIATTAGARLTLTNTSVGTSTRGVEGVHRFVWAL